MQDFVWDWIYIFALWDGAGKNVHSETLSRDPAMQICTGENLNPTCRKRPRCTILAKIGRIWSVSVQHWSARSRSGSRISQVCPKLAEIDPKLREVARS